MHLSRLLVLSVPLIVLVACGGTPADDRATGAPAARAAGPAASAASAKEVAREARGKLRCPPKIATPARASDAPVDDIVGVRPGLTYDEAVAVVQCSHDLLVATPDTGRRFNIDTFGLPVRQGFNARFAQERVVKSGQDYIREMQDNAMARATNRAIRDVKPGEAKWYVGTIGPPGEERVTNVAREEWFAEGRLPPIETVADALLTKYGAPTEQIWHRSRGQALLRWAFDASGQRIAAGSRLFTACNHPPEPGAGSSFSMECGVVVSAKIVPLRDNPAIAQYLQIGITNQARGYELITGTEQQLRQVDADRREREVQNAAQNAQAPTL